MSKISGLSTRISTSYIIDGTMEQGVNHIIANVLVKKDKYVGEGEVNETPG